MNSPDSAFWLLAFMVGGVIILCCVPKESEKKRKAREEYQNWALTRAVEIARYQKWVSPHRLRSQADMSPSQAQDVLRLACERGVLYQAVNGRYYIPRGEVKEGE